MSQSSLLMSISLFSLGPDDGVMEERRLHVVHTLLMLLLNEKRKCKLPLVHRSERKTTTKIIKSTILCFIRLPVKQSRYQPLVCLASSLSLFCFLVLSTKKEGKRKSKQGEESSLSLSIISTVAVCVHTSASGRYVRHEVKLVLPEPELRQLIGSVQPQLHH